MEIKLSENPIADLLIKDDTYKKMIEKENLDSYVKGLLKGFANTYLFHVFETLYLNVMINIIIDKFK